jgi:hypothetical protein
MTAAAAILVEIQTAGAFAYRRGDRVAIRPARVISADLVERVRRHKAELLAILPPAPPEVTTPEPEPWIVSSASLGNMRIVTTTHPSQWTPAVWRAAALVERLDELHRADAPGSQAIADELDCVLAELQREGITAWLTS